MIKMAVQTNALIEPLRKLSAYTAAPVLDLFLRLYVAWFFFNAGLIKLGSIINGDWAGVVEKFDVEWFYPVVIYGHKMDPTLMATLATAGELIFPILLFLGLFTRFAAVGALIMTAIIQFATPVGVAHESFLLFIMAGSLLLKGPGFFSFDHLVVCAMRARSAAMPGFKQQVGLEEMDTDIPGHERSGRFLRAMATGFWYTIIGLGGLHVLASLINLIPSVDLTSAMIVNIFSKTATEGAVAGYFIALAYTYVTGLIYAIASQKMEVVYTFKKSGLFMVTTGLIFMILYATI